MPALGASATPLAWDSERFGFPVARLDAAADAPDASDVLGRLRDDGVRLVYWTLPDEAPAAPAALLERFGGRLVDEKTTFVARTDALPADLTPRPAGNIVLEALPPGPPDEALRVLARQAGELSRFRVDPRLPAHVFPMLYDEWIRRSALHEIAELVVAARDGGETVGFVTASTKGGRGDIGLVAVDARARGRGVGKALVRAAQAWSRKRGHPEVQVVTQGGNASASALYLACGYAVERVERVYHFWFST